jgi:hypothetical protein
MVVGAGNAVSQLVEAVCYKPEGRGSYYRCYWNVDTSSGRTMTLALTASDRNEYQKQKNNVCGVQSAAGA